MARGNSEREQGMEKGKIRLIIAEVEGNNQTLQDLVRTMAPMLSRPVQVQVPPKLVPNGAGGAAPAARVPEADLFNQAPAAPEVIDSEPVDQPDAEEASTPRKKRGDGIRTDRNAGITPVTDLDFVPDEKPALRAFFAEKAPVSDMEQALVLGYYVQNTLGLSAFGPGHILSAFKHVGKPIPVDLRKTIRNMKTSKVWFNFSDIEAIRLTTEGENVVDHELPRTASAGAAGNR